MAPFHFSTTTTAKLIWRNTLLLLLLISNVNAAAYTFTYSGITSTNVTMKYMGVGLGHKLPGSNYLSWLRYLKPTAVRYFVPTHSNWYNLITARDVNAWGRSWGGVKVTTQATWEAAVAELRAGSNSPGDPDIWTWIKSDETVRWSEFIRSLMDIPTQPGATEVDCGGKLANVLPELRAAGYRVLAIWHITCNTPVKEMSAATAEYWMQRWELYRWVYLGARMFAQGGVMDVELYNEPDKKTCITKEQWIDEVRIRSVAIQNAYADASLYYNDASLVPTLIAPPTGGPTFEVGSYSHLAVQDVHAKFPGGAVDPLWNNFKELSYHQYNTLGLGFRSAWQKLSQALRSLPAGRNMPIRITEHNTYTSSNADAFTGVDVMDSADCAATLAGQVAGIVGKVQYSSVHKFSQTSSDSSSGVSKNGLMWGDLSADMNLLGKGLCDIGGVTKTGEAYRLMLRATPGAKHLYPFTSVPDMKSYNDFYSYTVGDAVGYRVYVANGMNDEAQDVTFKFGQMKGVAAASPVVVSAVTETLNGEVLSLTALSSTKTVTLNIPKNSAVLLTVPKGTVTMASLIAVDDVTVAAGSKSSINQNGAAKSVKIKTSATSLQAATSAAFFKFDLGAIDRSKIAFAVLSLTQPVLPTTPQVVTVFGTSSAWTENTLTWASAPGLLAKPEGSFVSSIRQNFINYKNVDIVGHMTAGVASQTTVMSLEVGDYLREGKDASFMVARLMRFDARGNGAEALPGDVMGLTVTINSRQAPTGKPMLHVVYRTA